jgi:hypothetical protein
MNETLNEHVIMLAQQREYTKELEKQYHKAREILEASDKSILSGLARDDYYEAKKMEIQLSDLVRGIALGMSSNTSWKDRNPHPATKVKKFTIVIIDDEKQAKQWAAKNAPSTLTLKTSFNRTVKEIEVDFVHNEIEYRTSVSRDLSEYVD